jgi:hypothetical protein
MRKSLLGQAVIGRFRAGRVDRGAAAVEDWTP